MSLPGSYRTVTTITLSVDGVSNSIQLDGALPTSPFKIHFLGAVSPNYYEVTFDEVYFWNKYLSDIEVTSLYNAGNGYFYPFASQPTTSYRIVSGVQVDNSGLNYSTTPQVDIAAPASGGDTAYAYATMTADTGRINADSFPALSVGYTNNVLSNIESGTGYFVLGDNDFLRIGNILHDEDWTVFLNFSATGFRPTGVSNVLVSTMEHVNQTSGLIFGINDANRLFFEYFDNTNTGRPVRRVFVQEQELSENNIVSVSLNSTHSTLTICNHSLAKLSTYGMGYEILGHIPCNTLFIGGFTNSGNDTRYTGFFGIMKDILVLSGAANIVQLNALAPLFCLTGYVPESQVPYYTYYPIVTGAAFIETIVGTGTTGYQLQAIDIPDKDGAPIPVYDLSPQTGYFSGSGVLYLSGTSSGQFTAYSGTEEQLFYDQNYLRDYADSHFVMLRYPILTGDWLEVYTYDVKLNNKISVLPNAYNIYDFYLSDDFNSNNANVYYNGLLQITGIDYILSSGRILSSGYGGYKSAYDYILYDEISGVTTFSGWTGWSGQKNLLGYENTYWGNRQASGAGISNSDPFILFDGQGLYLEGLEWDTQVYVESGDIIFYSGTAWAGQATSGMTIDIGTLSTGGVWTYADRLYDLYDEDSGPALNVQVTMRAAGYLAIRYQANDVDDYFQNNLDCTWYKSPPALTAKNDVYLNGQKLVSGIDFAVTGTVPQLVLTGLVNGMTPVWASGYWGFPPKRYGDGYDQFTGTGIGYYHDFSTTIGRLMDEMVWVNGQRLAPTIDYLTVSSGSLLNTDYRAGGWPQFWVYSGDQFGTGVMAERPDYADVVDDSPITLGPPAPAP